MDRVQYKLLKEAGIRGKKLAQDVYKIYKKTAAKDRYEVTVNVWAKDDSVFDLLGLALKSLKSDLEKDKNIKRVTWSIK